MRLAKQHSTGRNGRNVMCFFHLSQKTSNLVQKTPIFSGFNPFENTSVNTDHFPRDRGVFFLLSCFCRLGPFWFQYDWPQTRITLALSKLGSTQVACLPLALEVSKRCLKRQGIERIYTRKLTKLSPLFPWPFQ